MASFVKSGPICCVSECQYKQRKPVLSQQLAVAVGRSCILYPPLSITFADMPEKIRKWLPLFFLVVGMTFYLQMRFDAIFKCPSCFLFVDSADGLKNYFTSAYYVKHDKLGIWSQGMNYPYGEHVVYTDNQPIVSAIFKALDSIVPMAPHVIGSINMLMILSLLFTAIVLYCIMRNFGLPRWYAALLSVPITLLSPQIA